MARQSKIPTTLQRITVIDALRGFALLGVILTHMWQHYSLFSWGLPPREPLFVGMDSSIQWMMQNLVMGKFINIFAFLFGLSFFIQMDRARKKGVDFRKRFLWRMLLLFLIGLGGTMFYSGDILSIYAVFGVLLVFLYKVKGWILVVIASLLLIGTPRIITTTYDRIVQEELTVPRANASSATSLSSSQPVPSRRDRTARMEKPSFLNLAKANLTRGMEGKLNYQFGMFARGYITLAIFILGLLAGRSRFFEQAHTRKKRNIMIFANFVLGIIVINGLVSQLPQTSMYSMPRGSTVPVSQLTLMGLNDVKGVFMSGAIAMSFIILYQVKYVGRFLDLLSPYGRMGLSNYEMQNVIGCLLFSSWLFGSFFGRFGTTEVFLLGLFIYLLQIIFSKFWLKYCLYGPLEWLWRSGTYLKWQPFKKTDVPSPLQPTCNIGRIICNPSIDK